MEKLATEKVNLIDWKNKYHNLEQKYKNLKRMHESYCMILEQIQDSCSSDLWNECNVCGVLLSLDDGSLCETCITHCNVCDVLLSIDDGLLCETCMNTHCNACYIPVDDIKFGWCNDCEKKYN